MSGKGVGQEAEEEAIRDRDKSGLLSCWRMSQTFAWPQQSGSVSVFKNSNVKGGEF